MGVCAGAGQIISCCGLSIVLYQSGNKKIMSDSRVQSAVDYVKKWKGNGRFIVIVDCGVMCCLMSCIVSIVLCAIPIPSTSQRAETWPGAEMTSCCPEGAPDTLRPYEGYHWHDKGVVDQVGACTGQCTVYSRASNEPPRSFTIMEKAPTRWVSLGWKSI